MLLVVWTMALVYYVLRYLAERRKVLFIPMILCIMMCALWALSIVRALWQGTACADTLGMDRLPRVRQRR